MDSEYDPYAILKEESREILAYLVPFNGSDIIEIANVKG